jgi:hypothetical protein
MLTSIVISMTAAVVPNAAVSQQVCEVGRAALRDLPPFDSSGGSDTYVGGPDANHRDLLAMCPKLQELLPVGYRLTNSDARTRAAIHAPLVGVTTRPAVIYTIQIPEISANRQSASVHFSYECTGLCGGEFEARYVRTPRGWQRDGQVRPLAVS